MCYGPARPLTMYGVGVQKSPSAVFRLTQEEGAWKGIRLRGRPTLHQRACHIQCMLLRLNVPFTHGGKERERPVSTYNGCMASSVLRERELLNLFPPLLSPAGLLPSTKRSCACLCCHRTHVIQHDTMTGPSDRRLDWA